MGLSLTQIHSISEVAKHLYDYLPGSSAWKGAYTFAHAAAESGVGEFWTGGSKLPALTTLLEQTLLRRSVAFCPLVERIVTNGIRYRARKGTPLTRSEIENLNKLVSKVGFRIPALCDATFLASLPNPATHLAPEPIATEVVGTARGAERRTVEAALADLRTKFLTLKSEPDRPAAGLSLEGVLNDLFTLYGMTPNKAFRVVGEQIDGSFLLDSEVYLLEAKWISGPVGESDLLVFRGKVEGKSSFTRGLFISINGFSQPARRAIITGKQPKFVMMDGADLYRVLEGHLRLDELLQRKVRYLAERGEPYVSLAELFP
jgi:hypothetical protein